MLDRINLGDLHAKRTLFYAREAAAILYEVCSRLNNADEEGQALEVPTLDRLWVTPDGELIMDAATAVAGTDPMPALAGLIELVLPPPLRGQPDYAVPSSFRVLAPRARRFPPGLPPIDAPGDLAAAINRYRRGQSSTAILQGLFSRIASLQAQQADSPSAIEAGSSAVVAPSPLPLPAVSDGDPGDQSADTRDDVRPLERPLEAPTLVWPPLADSLDDLWLVSAPGSHNSEPLPEDVPLNVSPALPRGADPAFRRPRYVRSLLLAAAAMLLAFGTSYEVTHVLVSRFGGVGHAYDERPSSAEPVTGRSSRALHVPTQDRASIAHQRETHVPRGEARAIAAAPLEMPASTGPVFSPSFASGSSLLFHAGRDPAARLMMADLRGDHVPLDVVTIVNGGARNYHPRLSPDGKYLAFDSDRDGDRGVYVANRDGSDLHRVSGAGLARVPTWAPDMRWLGFVRGEPGHPQVWNLWLHDLATGEDRRLTSFRYGQVWPGSWFPDSRRVCYSHEDRLVILDIESGRMRAFPSPRAGRLVRTPAVSPDGRRIAFQVMHDGVWLLEVSSGAMQRIIDDPSAEEFAWAPDGGHLAYHSRQSGAWRIWLATIPVDPVIGP